MDTDKLLATRRHKVLTERLDQLQINLLAFHGGAPYIKERLSRFPSESDTDFHGDTACTPPALGRKDRAFLINYVKRITHKINQYVFQSDVQREGVAPKFLADCTASGMSLNQFMSEVSSLITVCRWCWIGVDRPPAPAGRSIAQREASGDRVYWKLYHPGEVVDWCFDAGGSLAWLMTEESVYENTDPRIEASEAKVRYLWEPGKITRMTLAEADGKFKAVDVVPIGVKEVPFIPCGYITSEPWWIDEIERIQRAIMDMLSSRDTNIFKAVFPLLVVSDAFEQKMLQLGGLDKTKSARRLIGVGNPLVESSTDSGLTRYLDVPADVFKVIEDAKRELESSLYEIVGLNMSVPESRQVASAEAKAWDHLDPETVLKERATMLEEIEAKAVDISARLGGPVFKPYTPVYGKKFDISDFAADIQALTSTSGFSLPPKSEKLVTKALVNALARRFGADKKELAEALKEVETYEPPMPSFETPPVVKEQDADLDQD